MLQSHDFHGPIFSIDSTIAGLGPIVSRGVSSLWKPVFRMSTLHPRSGRPTPRWSDRVSGDHGPGSVPCLGSPVFEELQAAEACDRMGRP
jgi:hypothetical protein